jgi:small ubiquitin-related modifier
MSDYNQSTSSSSSSETKTEPGASTTGKLKIRFQSQDGNETVVVVAPQMPFSKIFRGYCSNKGTKPESLRFLFDGNRIDENATPKSLMMEDNDVIDVLLQQVGG